ncbi:MAG: DUF2189 domain-containing protein [Pseudomonadota bacterium]
MTQSNAAILKPVSSLTADAPWGWLAAGWRDMQRAPVLSFGYGVAFVAIGLAITGGLWMAGLSSLIPVAIASFALAGPLMAVGLYEISRRLDAGAPLALRDIVFVKTKSPAGLALVGFFIMFALLFWARVAMLLYALFVSGAYMPLSDFTAFALTTPAGLSLLAVGTVIGGAIALAIFSVSALSIPMLMDRQTDAFTAIATSIRAVKEKPGPMLLWAWIIAVLIAAGFATLFVGLAVVFPLIGHATWRAYKDIIEPTA